MYQERTAESGKLVFALTASESQTVCTALLRFSRMSSWDSRIQGFVDHFRAPSHRTTWDTGDWQLKRPNGILYTIRVEDFGEKIQGVRPGKSVDSRTFSIGESKFRIKIIPKKSSQEESMRIFLRNESAWVVKVSCVLTVKNHKEDLGEHYYQVGRDGDPPELVISHSELRNGQLLGHDGSFILQADLKLLAEQVTEGRSLTGGLEERLEMLQVEVVEQRKEIQKLRRETEGLNELKEGMKELVRDRKELTELLQGLRGQPTVGKEEELRTMSCPMCTEEVLPPMRLRQCWEGHIICDSCFARWSSCPKHFMF